MVPPTDVRVLNGVSSKTRRLLANPEHVDVEFKRNHNAVTAEDLVAFANNKGGTILVGVDEVEGPDGRQRGEVVGCEVSDRARNAIISRGSACRPTIQLSVVVENTTRKPILRIEVKEGERKPYSTPGGTYKIRAEGQNVAIDPSMMRAIILEAEADAFVARFKQAADEVISVLDDVHSSLADDLRTVQDLTQDAIAAAEQAAQAAESIEGAL
jgi:predicted HTH transcriptional regulator